GGVATSSRPRVVDPSNTSPFCLRIGCRGRRHPLPAYTSSVAGARLAPDIGTRRYAIGLDLGAPLLEVARRGFSSTFSNQMRQLGGWTSTDVRYGSGFDVGLMTGRRHQPPQPPVLQLAHDLAGSLAARESGHSSEIRVGVAAPSWLGWSDRHHIAGLVDPRRACRVVWASTPMVAAFGTNVAGGTPLVPERVIAIDLDLGISASVVSIDRDGVRELLTASAPPALSNRQDTVSAVVAEISELARDRGVDGATRVVLVAEGAGPSMVVEQTIRALVRFCGDCPIDIVSSRAEIARAAVFLADMDSFEIVGAAPHGVGVLLDDVDPAGSSIHVVVARNSPTPGRSAASFDLGPDDGAQIYLDIYEEVRSDPTSNERAGNERAGIERAGEHSGHRLIMSARLDPGARSARAADVELSFVVGVDGQLGLQTGDSVSSTCTWSASTMVRSAVAADEPEPDASQLRSVTRSVGYGTRAAREMAPPLGLAEALGRAERIVSRQVGTMVGIRSAMGLIGCNDRDEPSAIVQRAGQMARALDRCPDDDAARAVRVALDVAMRAIESPNGRTFAGGSAHDVAVEIERVVEHLAVVIGAVTPAERNRLVLDAQLLGFDHERARSLVDQSIDESGVDSDGMPEALHDPTAFVVVSGAGFRLLAPGSPVDADQAVMRVLRFDQ
ncbi:MAG: hypothetical protein JWN99_1498, partial [Ilumatobacteraceae bacterium]|nr:hypothetical protein [Ilumatobacteraceae bacterium]